MVKENQRVVLTKRLLEQGLLELLKEKNLDKINVSELCRISGINRATFYRHFQTPADVLLEMQRDMITKMKGDLQVPKSLQELAFNFEKVCIYLYENADIVRIMIRNNSDTDLLRLISGHCEEIMRERWCSPYLNNLDLDSIRLMTTFFGGGGYLLLRQWLMEDIRKTPHEITQLLLQFADMNAVFDRMERIESGSIPL